MGKKQEGGKSSRHSGGFNHKTDPAQGFQSVIAELKDAVFTINPSQGDAAKFEKSRKVISNYVVKKYNSGILLVKGIQEGKLPVVGLDPTPRRKKKEKK